MRVKKKSLFVDELLILILILIAQTKNEGLTDYQVFKSLYEKTSGLLFGGN